MSIRRNWRGRVFFLLLLSLSLYLVLVWQHQLPPLSAQSEQTITNLDKTTPHAPSNYSYTPNDLITGSTTNCRIGAAVSGDQIPWLSTIGAGWYITFGTGTTIVPDVEFVQLVNIYQNKDGSVYLPTYRAVPAMTDSQLGAAVDANPGSLWIIGNEMERIGQGETFPEIYAIAFHDVAYFIKQRDPSAKIASTALVEVTPARLAYLELVWDYYFATFGEPMPVDVWTFHLYILPEVRPDGTTPNNIASTPLGVGQPPNPPFSDWRRESGGNVNLCTQDSVYCYAEHTDMIVFDEQIRDMRQWMKDHGQQDKPLLLTEFSVLYPYIQDPGGTCFVQDEYGQCFTPQRVSDYLQTTFDYLNGPASVSADLGYPSDGGRMVQQWLWYKLWVNGAGTASNLLVDDYATYSPGDPNALTIIGERYRDYTAAHPLQANLFPYQVGFSEVSNSAVDIHVSVMNNGNTATATGITVGVYADPDHNTLIGVANLGSVDGCARQELTATVRWDNLPPGQHTFYLAIDPANTISETNEDDNSVTGTVIISGQKIYLPQLRTGY